MWKVAAFDPPERAAGLWCERDESPMLRCTCLVSPVLGAGSAR